MLLFPLYIYLYISLYLCIFVSVSLCMSLYSHEGEDNMDSPEVKVLFYRSMTLLYGDDYNPNICIDDPTRVLNYQDVSYTPYTVIDYMSRAVWS